MKKKHSIITHCSILIAHLFLLVAPCYSIDFLFRPKGSVFIPMGAGNNPSQSITAKNISRYDVGGAADIGLELDLSTGIPNPFGIGYSAGLEAGWTTNPLHSDDPKNMAIYSLGGSGGLNYFPLSRLFLRIDGAAGVYRASLDGYLSPYGFLWRAGGEAGFRFSPSLLLAANSGWRQYEDSRTGYQPANSGFYAGLTAQLTLEGGGSSGRSGAEGVFVQYDPVYPSFLQLYQSFPIGNVVIRNKENAEIRNVRLSFRASPYTASEYSSGSVAIIPRGGEAEISLLADFSPAILRFTDNSRILGEIVIRYNFLGKEREAVSAVTVSSYSRNTVTEGDMAALAAFISPTSPEILEYSKYIIGLARSRQRIGHNQNMQYAIWLFEGLRALGIRVGETANRENEAQFPAETLAFGKGSSRDVGLLFAAALESVGISTAFIKVGTDYIIAVDLSVEPDATETMFNNPDKVLSINNEAWLPIAMSSFDAGFIASWTRAATTLNQAFERGVSADFVMTKDAWAVYPPAPLPELGSRAGYTNSETVLAETDHVIDQYITQDIMPLVWRVEAQISRNPTAALYNRLGILLARAGRISEAKTNYERAANMGLIPAMTNRGNLSLAERDYETAERWFRRALELDSRNSSALRGMERVEGRKE